MKILVISGFLGAGKTTFIKALSEKCKREFVVLENEYGDLGIDGPLLAGSDHSIINDSLEANAEGLSQLPEDTKIWELTEGCICCSMSIDFASSVLTISNVLDPDYLIVEPSGVAYLGAVIAQIQKICYDKISLLNPVTLVDYSQYERSLKDFEDCVSDQIDAGGWILLTKSESCHADDFEIFRKRMEKYNPNATIPMTHYENFPDSWWNQLLENDQTLKEHDLPFRKTPETPDLENFSLEKPVVQNTSQLISILNILVSGCCGRIVRGKGFLRILEEWIRFDLVGDQYTITGTDEMFEGRLVLIGKNLDRETLNFLFSGK